METANERFPSSKPVWWAWLDLNQRPHPCQAHSRDALKQQEGETPAQRWVAVTVVVRWGPWLTVRCGTQVARPARTRSAQRGRVGLQLRQLARPVLGDASLVGKPLAEGAAVACCY